MKTPLAGREHLTYDHKPEPCTCTLSSVRSIEPFEELTVYATAVIPHYDLNIRAVGRGP